MKIHNDTYKWIEEEGASVAAQKLFNRGYTKEQIYKIFDEINFYPDNGIVEQAEQFSKRSKAALKDLNKFFGFN